VKRKVGRPRKEKELVEDELEEGQAEGGEAAAPLLVEKGNNLNFKLLVYWKPRFLKFKHFGGQKTGFVFKPFRINSEKLKYTRLGFKLKSCWST